MNDCIYHRGPDDEGFYLDTSCGLAMRRLSIIDLVTGKQPIHNEDETVWVVLNGELYNFLDLREDLLKKGHRFYTKTDTEVVVHLYEEYGEEFVKHIWGMFGVAVWDTKQKRLIIARDRVGKKPLFYRQHETGIVFGSEIKSILQDPRLEPELNHEALYHYLTLKYIPAPLTIYRGISKLPPAHYLVLEEGKMRIERYWEVSMEKKLDCSYEEACSRLRALMTDAVKIRLISDVPLGAFLSGGIDSSLIVGLMAQHASLPVKTFTVGFDEESHSELPYADVIAKMFGTDHHEIMVRPDAQKVLPELLWHFDEPFGDYSAIPSYYVAQEARRNITVALNGDGGDESFAGYRRYRYEQFIKTPLGIPASELPVMGFSPIRSTLLKLAEILPPHKLNQYIRLFYSLHGQPWERVFAGLISIYPSVQKNSILSADFRNQLNGVVETEELIASRIRKCDSPVKLDRMQFCDLATCLPDDMLVKIDRMTMAHSLEGRSPLLDHRIIEFAASLPPEWKLEGSTGKKIVRDTFPEILVDKIANRPKMGFSPPLGSWLRTSLKDLLMDTLDSERFHQRGYFEKSRIKRLIKEHMSGVDHAERLWVLIMFELWHRMYLDEKFYRTNEYKRFIRK